jgi:hypothetical protein
MKRQGRRTLCKYLKESVFVKFHILPKWSWSLGEETTTSHFSIPNDSTINELKFLRTPMNPRPIEDISNSPDVGQCT